jgi:predicted adenine nucleotide alpha hydrolase (AANH) superfamily ATPase
MKRLLLHVCCGPCSTHVINELKGEFKLTLLFYNPNVYPEAEYLRRLEAAKQVAKDVGVMLVEGNYDSIGWENYVAGHENEQEGGKRCELCYEFRLRKTAEMAKGFEMFATTLTVSPHKNASKINEVGRRIENELGVKFLLADFKKRDGFLKSVELSKKCGIYRQNYCGCRFSFKRSIASPKL